MRNQGARHAAVISGNTKFASIIADKKAAEMTRQDGHADAAVAWFQAQLSESGTLIVDEPT